jgi:hypothetical protein
MPPGFQSRVNTNVVPVQARQGGSTGSAIAEGVAQLGQTLGRVADQDAQVQERIADSEARLELLERNRSDDELALAVAVEQAKSTQRLRVFDEENRNKADYETLFGDKVDDEVSALTVMIGDNERIAARFAVPLEQMAQTEKADAKIYAMRVRSKAMNEGFKIQSETLANQAYSDPTKVASGVVMLHDNVMNSSVIDDSLKPAILRELLEPVRLAQLRRGIDEGKFAEVRAQLDAGVFDTDLSHASKMRLLGEADVAENEAARAAQEAEMLQREAAREAAKQIDARIDGGEIIDPKTMGQAAAAMRAAGVKESEVIAFENKTVEARVNQTYNPQADPMGTQASMAASALEAKIFSGRATPDEERRYKHLKKIGDSRAKARGAQLKEQAKQGIAGQATVLSELRAMPAEQRFLAAEEAKPGLGQLALLGPRSQQYALEGREVRNARKDEFGKAEEVKAAFDRRIGGIKASLGGEYDNIMGIAWDIYAGELNGRSASGWNEAQFDVAVKVALGATKRDNGVLQGGVGRVRGKQVILPDWKTPEEFDKTLSTLKFDGAVYDNKQPASKADILANYRPEFYDDDAAGQPLYRFISPTNKPLRHKDGSIYNLVVQR